MTAQFNYNTQEFVMKKLIALVLGVFVMTSFAFATGDKSAPGNVTIKVYRDFGITYVDNYTAGPYWMIIDEVKPFDAFEWTVTGEAQFTLDWSVTFAMAGSAASLVGGTQYAQVNAEGWNGMNGNHALDGTFPAAGQFKIYAKVNVKADVSGTSTLTATATVGNYQHF